MTKRWVQAFILTALLLVTASDSFARSKQDPSIWTRYTWRQEPAIFHAGHVMLKIALAPITDTSIKEVTLIIEDTLRLRYLGEWQITRPVSRTDSMIFELPLVLPVHDTCGINGWFKTEGKRGNPFARYWIVMGDSASNHRENPLWSLETFDKKNHIIYNKQYDSLRKAQEELEKNFQPIHGQSFTDKQGNEITEQQYLRLHEIDSLLHKAIEWQLVPINYDSADPKVRQFMGWEPSADSIQKDFEAKKEARKANNKLLQEYQASRTGIPDTSDPHFDNWLEADMEKYPEAAEMSSVLVDGVLYTRLRGEPLFHVAERQPQNGQYTDADYRQDFREAVLSDTTVFHRIQSMMFEGVLDLRDERHHTFFDSAVGNLEPVQSEGFYRAVMSFRKFQYVVSKRIPYQHIRTFSDPVAVQEEDQAQKPDDVKKKP